MSSTMQPEEEMERFSDLLEVLPDGRPRLLPGIHPLPELLEMEADQILQCFKQEQVKDFSKVISELGVADNPLSRLFDNLRGYAEQETANPFGETAIFDNTALSQFFMELHDHVMAHPVWRHPFFIRVFHGEFDREQLTRFAVQYFNQVKNTRQCVALALGRFSGTMALPYGCLNERLSELTQIVLAQLLADEYGVGSHSLEDYPSLGALFESTTHIVMYRRLFDGLDVAFPEQDQPMLQGVADNVLIQRLVAGNNTFTPLEALASVGLGMEWGVPEFFSLLLGGMIRFAWQNQVPLTSEHLQVFIAHVQYDVLHAISVMLVTSLYIEDEGSINQIKQATNMLMSGRYAMMSDIYQFVFKEACAGLYDIELDSRYHLTDHRIETELRKARMAVGEGTVVDVNHYRKREDMPFVFKQNA